MTTVRLALASLTLTLVALSAAAGPAIAGGPLQSPFSPSDSLSTHGITACFDLDRDSGPIADWSGWTGTSWVYTHAYDDHSGTDWGMVNGTPLHACISGTVTAMRDSVPNDDHSDTGNYIIYQGTVGSETYRVNNWHLSQNSIIPAGVGSAVTQGQHIADSDNTGNSTGPHLHFGAYVDSASGLTTCPFFNGLFTQDEFYYDDARICLRYLEVDVTSILNVREGDSTSYPIITEVTDGLRFVACERSGWYRFFLPSAPSRACESRTSGGGVTPSPQYVETGPWTSSADKSLASLPIGDANRVVLEGVGSRRVAAGSAATAQFVPDLTQQGECEVFVTWPAQANASGVTCTVNHAGGSSNVVIDQIPGTGTPGGTGTHANPYVITTNHFVADHTTVGGDDVWNSYSPVGSGIPEEGPERVYVFTLPAAATVTVTVEHEGYPSLDVDIQLLNTLSNTNCVARADWSTSYAFAAGTHYLSIDSYGSGSAGDAAATSYRLTVDIDTEMADSWVSLGTYDFDRGQSAANGSVTIDASTASGAQVYADAVKFVPTVWRSGWFSDAYVTVLDGATDSVCCVGVRTDATDGDDARDLDDSVEVPIHAGPNASSPVVAKAISGQRFVCTNIWNDFYLVYLPSSADASQGWISGEHLFVYHPERASASIPAELTVLTAD
ncbi:M23 family metallopeptidase [Candidatus Sumerlaeota bacterium]|nr:M23 family metallopeptidase [Candidatus Sumerlaeota bacterium]